MNCKFYQTNASKEHEKQQGKDHRKSINSTTTNNRTPKENNANENTTFQRKKGVFYAVKFVHFKDDAARYERNTFVAAMMEAMKRMKFM